MQKCTSNLSLTFSQFCNTLLQHFWLLQHIAAALLVAAASWNLVGSIIRLQRCYTLSFIFTEFIIFEKSPFATNVLQICCNLQHKVTWIKGWAFQIDRQCKTTLVTQVWHTFLNLNPRPIDVLQICCNMLQFAAYCFLDQRGSLPDQ